MALTKRLRFEVMRRDNHACRYCGQMAPDVKLTIDHVVPVALGGTDDPDNLVTACADCNAGKSSMPAGAPLIDDVAESSTKWAAAIKSVAESMSHEVHLLNQRRSEFHASWTGWTNGYGDTMPLPGTWEASIDKFYSVGMTADLLDECIRIAMSKRGVSRDAMFRYFCGVAWSKVREIQEAAMKVADSQETAGAT